MKIDRELRADNALDEYAGERSGSQARVKRTRLLSMLARSAPRLVQVCAPAGFGKSTLLDQWRVETQAEGRATLLVADTHDGQRLGIEQRVRTALAELIGEAGVGGRQVRELVSRASVPIRIVIEDCQHLDCKELGRVIHDVLSGRDVQVALSSRTKVGVDLAALRARGETLTIGWSDLAFDDEELRTFALEDSGFAEKLGRLTEGWPLLCALEASALSVTGHAVGQCDYVRDFIALEFVQPKDSAFAMLRAAAEFDAFCVDLLDAICTVSSRAPLDRMLVSGFPIFRIDNDSRWLRLHPALRQVVLDTAPLGLEARKLHGAAADWFLKAGNLGEAVRQARRGEDPGAVSRIFSSVGIGGIGAIAGMEPLRVVLDGETPAEVAGNLHIRLGRALVIAKEGRVREARCLVDKIAGAMRCGDGEDAVLAQNLNFIDRLLAFYEDAALSDVDVDDLETQARGAAEAAPWFAGWLNNLLFLAYFDRGDLIAARVAGENALSWYREAGNAYAEAIMQQHLGALDLADGLVRDAQARVARASSVARSSFRNDRSLVSLIDIGVAEVLVETDHLKRASEVLEAAIPEITRREAWVDLLARAFLAQSRVTLALSGSEAAVDELRRFARTAVQRDLPRLQTILRVREMDILTWSGALARADELRASLARGTPLRSWREKQLFAVAIARHAVHRRDAAAATHSLADASALCNEGAPQYQMLAVRLLRILHLDAIGDLDGAAAELRYVVTAAAPEQRFRSFLEEGHPLAESILHVIRHAGLASFNSTASSFLTRLLAGRGQGVESEPVARAHILSQREREVLFELSLGKPNKLIARSLGVSEATVKFHLAHVYEKLGVNSRMLAVAVARERGLIE